MLALKGLLQHKEDVSSELQRPSGKDSTTFSSLCLQKCNTFLTQKYNLVSYKMQISSCGTISTQGTR